MYIKYIKSSIWLVITLYLLISIISYYPNDLSLNTSSTIQKIYNIGGTPGAYIADVIIQIFGASGIMLCLFFFILAKKTRDNMLISKKKLFLYSILSTITTSGLMPTIYFFSKINLFAQKGFIGNLILQIPQSHYIKITMFISTIYLILKIFNYSIKFPNILNKIKLTKKYKSQIQIQPVEKIQDITVENSKIENFINKNFLLKDKNDDYISTKQIQNTIYQNNKNHHDIVESNNKEINTEISELEKTYTDINILPIETNNLNNELTTNLPTLDYNNTNINSKEIDINEYTKPTIELLDTRELICPQISENILEQNAQKLENALSDFGIQGNIVNVTPGPVVTLYELEPAPGIKSSRIIGLSTDIARALSATSIRIAVIPGKNVMGIEIPNHNRQIVSIRSILESENYINSIQKLPLALGVTINGENIVADLAKMPHLLIAGTTGSGKSVAINTMIISLIYSLNYNECKFIMIDPKMLELSLYNDIPHLITPVVTDSKKAVIALKWVVGEMEARYKIMSQLSVRNIDGYNQKISKSIENNEIIKYKTQGGFDENNKPIFKEIIVPTKHMPTIVVIVDEMADLMLLAGKEIESLVQRLAQMARAAGIHIIMATQRPSVDVITGVIKANFPTRISFAVTSKIDSRTILGEQGAESLLGMGDMLYMSNGGKTQRLHSPFISDKEIQAILNDIKSKAKPCYLSEITTLIEDASKNNMNFWNEEDSLYTQAVAIVKRDRKASISYLQRQLKIGFNRAASLIEMMEKEGIVSEQNGTGKRSVVAT